MKPSLALLLAGGLLLATGGAANAADVAKGEKLFNRCKVCHTLEAGKKKIGPSLHGVFGREAGTAEGFKYSKAMQESDIVWDEETIDGYLADPRGYMPGNKMAFPGLRKDEDRADLIAYLMEAAQ